MNGNPILLGPTTTKKAFCAARGAGAFCFLFLFFLFVLCEKKGSADVYLVAKFGDSKCDSSPSLPTLTIHMWTSISFEVVFCSRAPVIIHCSQKPAGVIRTSMRVWVLKPVYRPVLQQLDLQPDQPPDEVVHVGRILSLVGAPLLHDAEVLRPRQLNARSPRCSRAAPHLVRLPGVIQHVCEPLRSGFLSHRYETFRPRKILDVLRLVEVGRPLHLVSSDVVLPFVAVLRDDNPQLMPILRNDEPPFSKATLVRLNQLKSYGQSKYRDTDLFLPLVEDCSSPTSSYASSSPETQEAISALSCQRIAERAERRVNGLASKIASG